MNEHLVETKLSTSSFWSPGSITRVENYQVTVTLWRCLIADSWRETDRQNQATKEKGVLHQWWAFPEQKEEMSSLGHIWHLPVSEEWPGWGHCYTTHLKRCSSFFIFFWHFFLHIRNLLLFKTLRTQNSLWSEMSLKVSFKP